MNQRWRLAHAPVLTVALLVLSSSGCGGSGGHGSRPADLGQAFRSRAQAVCQVALAQKRALGPFPYPSFNPTKPDRSKLPPIARLEAKTVKIYETWLRQMLALGKPPTGTAAWTEVVGALRSNGRIIADQQRAAQRVDARTFTNDYYDGNKAQHGLEVAARAAGVPVCVAAAAA
jgi:hypothetical protein